MLLVLPPFPGSAHPSQRKTQTQSCLVGKLGAALDQLVLVSTPMASMGMCFLGTSCVLPPSGWPDSMCVSIVVLVLNAFVSPSGLYVVLDELNAGLFCAGAVVAGPSWWRLGPRLRTRGSNLRTSGPRVGRLALTIPRQGSAVDQIDT